MKNTYASLADVLSTVRPALTEHGIAIVQSPDMLAEHRLVTLTTRLIHTSGQWIQGTACAPAPEPNAATNPVQMVGSAIRYLCRYGLEAMVGVAEESVDDADGQPAQPGAVRTLGTVPAAAAAVQDAAQAAGPVPAKPMDLAGIAPATDTDAAAEAGFQAGASDAEKAERQQLQTTILAELARLNAEPDQFEAALQQQFGVASMIDLSAEQSRQAIDEMRKLPTPEGAA